MTEAERPEPANTGSENGSDETTLRDRLASIAAFGRAMNSARSAVDVAEFVAEEICVAAEAAAVSISRWEPHRGLLRTLVNVGELADWEERRPASETYGAEEYTVLMDVVAAGRAAVFRVDDPATPVSERENLERLGKHSSLTAAIRYGDLVWGELYLTRTADQPPFSKTELEFALGMAGFVAMAFAQGERADSVAQIAFIDPLTGLANRRRFEEVLEEAFERRGRETTHVGLVLCDVNGLKRVNDAGGHEAGDRLLVAMALAVQAAASSTEGALPARLGGDEFGVVVSGGSAETAVHIAELLCREAWSIGAGLGVSCGVASTAEEALAVVDSPRRLLRIADAAQYRAKRAGMTGPVVAGRETPVEAVREAASADRRRYRGTGALDSVEGMIEAVIRGLDAAQRKGSRERLRVVCEVVGRGVNAAAWYTASVEPGTRLLVTRDGEAYRPSNTAPVWDEVELVGEEWRLDDYPRTESVLGGGGFLMTVDDALTEPSELAVLLESGYAAVLAAGGTDADGWGWLVEVYGDDVSRSFEGMAPVLRALVAAALANVPAPPAVPSARSSEDAEGVR